MKNIILLRLLKPTDAAAITRHLSDPEMFRNLMDYIPNPYSITDAVEFIERSQENTGGHIIRAIEVDGILAGIIGVEQQKDVYRKTAKMGYWLGKTYWGRGIMTEAVRQCIPMAFQQLDIVKLYANTFATNPASRRVLEKAGFTREAILKKAVYKNGEVMDYHLYALFAREGKRPY